ncbi:MAG: hypothetical protein M3P12_13690 [Gemmatimonadota bacterium]|nr:hypothetical protein [Gemmatimonadota bacterium]
MGMLTDRDGRPVELYQRPDPPPFWWIRWQLLNGAIYSHIREEDGVEMAGVTAHSVSIVGESPGETPVVLAEAPLLVGASTQPGYQEVATYVSPLRGDPWSVSLQRPGFVPDGSQMITSGAPIAIRAGTPFGIEVEVVAGDREGGLEIVSEVLKTLAEV